MSVKGAPGNGCNLWCGSRWFPKVESSWSCTWLAQDQAVVCLCQLAGFISCSSVVLEKSVPIENSVPSLNKIKHTLCNSDLNVIISCHCVAQPISIPYLIRIAFMVSLYCFMISTRVTSTISGISANVSIPPDRDPLFVIMTWVNQRGKLKQY